jgi:methylated-DNA-protein-cysteine methyltransferase-like protein
MRPPVPPGAARPRGARPEPSLHARILAVVRRIPRGRVATYGQVAALAGLPRHARLVGYALHALPDATPVPWHRVLGAGGRVSLDRSPGGAGITQRLRLEREGVRFDARGRADLGRFGWRGTGAARIRALKRRRG